MASWQFLKRAVLDAIAATEELVLEMIAATKVDEELIKNIPADEFDLAELIGDIGRVQSEFVEELHIQSIGPTIICNQIEHNITTRASSDPPVGQYTSS